MNSILKYLTGSSKTKLQASPEILARVTANIARLEAEAFAEATVIFNTQEAAEQASIKQQQKLEEEQRLKTESAEKERVIQQQRIEEQKKAQAKVQQQKKQVEIEPSKQQATQTLPEKSFVGKSATSYRPYTQDTKLGKYTQAGAVLGENLTIEKPLKVSLGTNKVEEPYFQLTNPTEEDIAKNTIKESEPGKISPSINPQQGSLDFKKETVEAVKKEASEKKATIKAEAPLSDKIDEPSFQLTSPTEESIAKNTLPKETTNKVTIFTNPDQGSLDFTEKKAPVIKPSPVVAAPVVENTSTALTEEARAKAEANKREADALAHATAERDRLRAEAAARAAKPTVDPNTPKPPPLQTQTTNGGTPQPHANTPKRTFADLSKANLFSFDTETTGIDTQTAKIWQYGFAEKSANSSDYTGLDYHVSPFDDKKLTDDAFIKNIREVNGDFSQNAFKEGNFAGIIQEQIAGTLEKNTHSEGLFTTLSKINEGSILVMQNMNFENNLLREGFERGDYSQSMYTNLQDKMLTSGLDEKLQRTNDLLHRPAAVEKYIREADFTYHTEFSRYRTADSFKKYTGYLNAAFDEYDSIIKLTKSTSKIPVIELMDITKTFLANLADNGLIEKETSTLGLNINYLTRSFYGRAEEHTAFSDSKDTLQLFEDMFKYTKDMRNGIISDELRDLAKTLKDNQPAEVNRRFVASVASTLEDFISKGKTKSRAGTQRYYSPGHTLLDNSTGQISDLSKIGIGARGKKEVTSLEEALMTQLSKYAETYQDEIEGFNRKAFVKDLLGVFNEDTSNYSDVKAKLNSITIPTVPPGQASAASIVAKKEGVLASTFNGKHNKVLIGLAAVAGLGYMAYSPPPKQIEDENRDLPVYSNFYDEQYLGTGFVEFRERNKRYVY